MNVFDHLVQEHDQAKQVMEQLKEKPQKRMWTQLKTALEQHIGGEEQVVYKAMDKFPELHTHVLESLEEHRVAKRLLGEIDKLEPKDEKWQAKFKVLKEAVEHHIEEEEGTIFPEAQQLIDQQAAEELDSRYSEAEKKLAA
jgi:hemerythrin-like domain-containing protein